MFVYCAASSLLISICLDLYLCNFILTVVNFDYIRVQTPSGFFGYTHLKNPHQKPTLLL